MTREAYGQEVEKALLERLAPVAHLIHHPPAWIDADTLAQGFLAMEAIIPDLDIARLHTLWLRSRELPLHGLLRAGLAPEWMFARAPQILHLFAPQLAVDIHFHRRGTWVDFDYRITFPDHWPKVVRHWTATVIGGSHAVLLKKVPFIREIEVTEIHVGPNARLWRIRWIALPSWLPLVGLTILTLACGSYLGWGLPAIIATVAMAVGYALARLQTRTNVEALSGILNLAHQNQVVAEELAQRHSRIVALERRHQVGAIAARLVHELPGPLTTARLATGHLFPTPVSGTPAALLTDALDRSERVITTIRQSRTLQPPSLITMSCAQVLEQFAVTTRAVITASHGQMVVPSLTIETACRTVLVLENALEVIADNLARNAREAQRPGVPLVITLSVMLMPDAVRFGFEDNGLGMNEEQVAMLFGGVTSKPDGLGLGLGLCRELCQQMGAEVNLLRTAPEMGASFGITVRLTDPTAPTKA